MNIQTLSPGSYWLSREPGLLSFPLKDRQASTLAKVRAFLTDLSQISPPCTESTVTLKGVLPMDPLLGQTGQKPWLLNSDPGCHIEEQKSSRRPQKRTHFSRAQASISGQDPFPVFKKTYTMGRILVRVRLGDGSITNNLPTLSGLQSQRFLAPGFYGS